MGWHDLWRHPPKYLSYGETQCSGFTQRNRWIRGGLIVREEDCCKMVERHQREPAVIASGGTTNR